MHMSRFGLLVALLLLPRLTSAQTPATAPADPAPQTATTQRQARALVVLNAKTARLDGRTLSLDGVAASAIVFADRPIRRAGYMQIDDLLKLWSAGSFAKDPPNATVSAFARDGAQLADAVVVLKAPRLDGAELVFDVTVLEGSLGAADGPAALFIDTIWFGVGSTGVHYLGQNQTTGGTNPAFGSRNDTSNPNGWSNPAPNGPPDAAASRPQDHAPVASPPNGAALSAPPAGAR